MGFVSLCYIPTTSEVAVNEVQHFSCYRKDASGKWRKVFRSIIVPMEITIELAFSAARQHCMSSQVKLGPVIQGLSKSFPKNKINDCPTWVTLKGTQLAPSADHLFDISSQLTRYA